MKTKLDINYWNKLKACAEPEDLIVISESLHKNIFSDWQKEKLSELLLTSRIRLIDEEEISQMNEAIGIFNRDCAVEPLFYTESEQVFCTWRYSYKQFAKAIPKHWAVKAIRNVYNRLGIELDTDGVQWVLDAEFVYAALFDLIADAMGDNKFIYPNDVGSWSSFAFTAYFNLWHIFGVMGFNGYSPYTICADIGLLCPPACSWGYQEFNEEQKEAVEELKIRARGRSYPTWQQNRFLGLIAKI